MWSGGGTAVSPPDHVMPVAQLVASDKGISGRTVVSTTALIVKMSCHVALSRQLATVRPLTMRVTSS